MIRWHRRIALGFSVLLGIQLLTGVMLVFRDEITAIGLPPAGVHEPHGSLQDVRRAAIAVWPHATVAAVQFPSAWTRDFIVRLQDSDKHYLVAVDPGDFSAARVGIWGHWLLNISELHEDLLLGLPGRAVTALNAVALCTLVGTGWYLWWPRRGGAAFRFPVRAAVRVRLFHWHRSLGAVTGLTLLPGVLTGLMLAVGPFLPSRTATQPAPAVRTLDDDERVHLARSLFPQLAVRELRIDRASGTVTRVVLRQPGAGLRAPITDVLFDAKTGRVSYVIEGRESRGYWSIAAWAFPVHSAQVGGLPARAALAVTGMLALCVAILGIWMWSARRTPGNYSL